MLDDRQLQQAVLDELNWEPSLGAGHIGVSARGGVVTLTGHVASFQEKRTAEEAAYRVKGVRAVAEALSVRLPADSARSDEDIAIAAIERLAWDDSAPKTIRVKVENGWVTLSGPVAWRYQRENAENDVASLRGVVGVTNAITIEPSVDVALLSDDIVHALHRSWFFDPKTVMVTARDGKVWLSGTVTSEHDRRIAAATAWKAPGVRDVVNELTIV